VIHEFPVVLRPTGHNLAQGVIEVGSTALLLAVAVGGSLADAGVANAGVVLGAALTPCVAIVLVIWRYVPMSVELDRAADEVRFRNAWTSGTLRWSHIDGFEASQAFVGYRVARAVLQDGRKVKLRAAPYDRFVDTLRRVTSVEG
jgi:hypothetical protein